jgi:hypothetical protein
MRRSLLLLAAVLLVGASVSATTTTTTPTCPLCYVPGGDIDPFCYANYGKICTPPFLVPHCTDYEASLYCEGHPYNSNTNPTTTP